MKNTKKWVKEGRTVWLYTYRDSKIDIVIDIILLRQVDQLEQIHSYIEKRWAPM